MFIPSESTIILAIVGMIGIFSTAIIYQRANKLAHRYLTSRTQAASFTINKSRTE